MIKKHLQYLLDKIDIREIIYNHVKTLKVQNKKNLSVHDLITFFVFPLVISLVLCIFKVEVNNNLTGTLLNVFSIFAGLLFNLLVLIYDIFSKIKQDNSNNNKTGKQTRSDKSILLLKEIYNNISFGILISLISVILLAISIFPLPKLLKAAFSFFIFYFLSLFILTLLMILKRIHSLLSHNINEND
jgi:hypothetical protein